MVIIQWHYACSTWKVQVFYWKPVYKILECPDMKVWIVNARHIKYVPGHKTDKKDRCLDLQTAFSRFVETELYPGA